MDVYLVKRPTVTGLEISDLVVAADAAGQSYHLDVDPVLVAAGEVGVIVAQGAVATALADVLVGLASPLRGQVRVRGTAVTGQPAGNRGIALVPADGGLLPHLTVEHNVAFGLGGKAAKAARDARVGEVLASLELTGLRRRRPHEISPEQQMRVAVARTMCMPGRTAAVVIEDGGGPACRTAVMTATGQDLAVVLITGAPGRAGEFGRPILARCRPSSL